MNNADEIVLALQICNRSKGHRCSECPVFSKYPHRSCKKTVDKLASALIESLQTQLSAEREKYAELQRYNVACTEQAGTMLAEKIDLQADLARVTQTRDDYATAARAIALCLSEFCDNSLPYDQMIADAARKAVGTLARVTAERDAAVEDIMCRDHCDVCVSGHEHDGECAKADYDCMTCKSATCLCRECRNENKWQWRGVKGEQE